MVDLPQLRPDERGRQPALLRLRNLAGLTTARVVLALALLLGVPAGANAADPSTPPTQRPPTCAERFPDEGPAGVDLRLGCIVSEVISQYSPGQAATPPPISTYALILGGIGLVAALVGLLGVRLLARRAGRAMAAVTPDAWWMCPRCRSVNGAGVARCYSCGQPMPNDVATLLSTDDRPVTPQTFGRGKHD